MMRADVTTDVSVDSRTPAAASARASRPTGVGRRGAQLGQWGPLAILAVVALGAAISSSQFLTTANIQTIAAQAAIPLVLVCGLTFVVVQGSIDLSLEGTMAVCSVATALLVANDYNGDDLGYLGVLIVVVVGAVIGLANGLLYTRLRIPSLLVTLGTWFVGLGLAALLFPGRTPRVRDDALRSWSLHEWLGVSRLVYVALACLLVAWLLQGYTRFGRYSYAIGGGEETARLSGLRLDRYKVAAFAFAGLMAGVAAVMATARLGVGSAQAGEGQLFPAISAVVIGGTLLSGGRGGVLHGLVGVLILTVLNNGMLLAGVDSYIQQAVQGAIIVAAVVATNWHLRDRMRVIK
jgi:ribose transport system permease protein